MIYKSRDGVECKVEFVDSWKQPDTITTPNDIEILIHYRCSSADHPRLDAPAVQGACERFCELGLLFEVETNIPYHENTKHYAGNLEALAVYVDALCNVPLPTQKWTINEEKKK